MHLLVELQMTEMHGTGVKMSMEYLWNDSNRRKVKCSEKNLSQCHYVSHMHWPGIEPKLSLCEDDD